MKGMMYNSRQLQERMRHVVSRPYSGLAIHAFKHVQAAYITNDTCETVSFVIPSSAALGCMSLQILGCSHISDISRMESDRYYSLQSG